MIRNRHNPDPPTTPSPNSAQRGHAGPAQNVQYDPTQELVSCAQLAVVPALGRCRSGATVAAIEPDYGGGLLGRTSMADTSWPSIDLSEPGLDSLSIDTLIVATDGPAAVEEVRSELSAAYPSTFAPETMSELRAESSRALDGYRQLADVVILTSLPIAGCSLAVNIAGGLAERKRPFSLLRLTGAPVSMLRRVIAFEAVTPLLVTTIVSVGTGLLTAQLFLRAQLHETLQAPGPQYYLVIVAGLVASLAMIASTLPLLNRLSEPGVARND